MTDKFESTDYKEKDVLNELYWNKGLSLSEIGDVFDVSSTTVRNYMIEHSIPRRESNSDKPLYIGENSRGYIEIRTWNNQKGKTDVVLMHRFIAIAEYGLDAVCRNDVHHINGFKFDNRGSNLEPITKSKHGKIHAEKRWGNSD